MISPIKAFRYIALSIVILGAVGCGGQYSVRTNKDPGFSSHLTRVSVWSGISTIPLLSEPRLAMGDSFANFFKRSLAKGFAESNVEVDIRPFSTETDGLQDLMRFEKDFAPEYRVVIAVPRYHTITSRGITNMLDMNLDISLYTARDNRRIWRSEIVVDGGLAPGLTWRQDGAERLGHQIIDALKRDSLI